MDKEEIQAGFLQALHSVLRADPAALTQLIEYHVKCSDEVASDSVMAVPAGVEGGYLLGLLGLINGILIGLGVERIAAVFGTNDQVVEFVPFSQVCGIIP